MTAISPAPYDVEPTPFDYNGVKEIANVCKTVTDSRRPSYDLNHMREDFTIFIADGVRWILPSFSSLAKDR